MNRLRVLFVCSHNQWRSPTAEAIYRNDPRVEVSSAGVSASARRRVSEKMLRAADLILVMEREHRQRLRSQFSVAVQGVRIEVLDVPDDFEFMDPELIVLLKSRVEPLLKES